MKHSSEVKGSDFNCIVGTDLKVSVRYIGVPEVNKVTEPRDWVRGKINVKLVKVVTAGSY